MVKTKREFIFATFFTSGIAVIVSFVALGTQAWVDTNILLDSKLGSVQYGLFSGTYERILASIEFYELTMTCDFGENSCAMLCGNTGDNRKNALAALTAGESISFDTNCPKVVRTSTTRSKDSRIPASRATDSERQFINSGVWLSTIIFLVISCLAGLLSSGLSVWNAAANPVEIWFNTFGLYVYNGIACGCSLLVVLLWGVHFGVTLVKNACILETITGDATSDGYATLGYSYWLNLVALILYISSIVILAVRQYLVNKEPEEKIEIEAHNDALILF